MRFTPDETQQEIVRLTGDALDAAGADLPERAWKALGQAGLLGLAVPVALGGDGLGALETMLVLRELGRRGVCGPALATLALGVLPVVGWATADQQRALLAGLATPLPGSTVDLGSAVLTAAIREPSDPRPGTPRTRADANLAVTGTKLGVPYAAQARRILVPVTLAGGATAVALIDPHAAGVTLRRTYSSTGLPEYTVCLDRVRADGLLGDPATRDRRAENNESDGSAGTRTVDAVTGLYQLAAAGACALGAGAVAGALALTTVHIGDREQFGRPLAAFQAVAQQIADVYVAARTIELATLSAGWRLSTGRAVDAEVAVAAYWFAVEAPAALRTCHHLHGGLGLDVSYPLHRFSALIGDLVGFLGGAEHCLDRLGGPDVHRPD